MTGGARVPDAEFIRREVPTTEIASMLGLKVEGRRFECWRSGVRHKRRRSVGLWVRGNSLRCFECHARTLSPVDLVMDVLGLGVGEAFRWIAQRFEVPSVRLGETKKTAPPNSGAASIQSFVCSAGYQKLSDAAKLVAVAVLARMPVEHGEPVLRTTLTEIMPWSGVGNRGIVARCLGECEALGLFMLGSMSNGRTAPAGLPARSTIVRLTWEAFLRSELNSGDSSEMNADRSKVLPQNRSQLRSRAGGAKSRPVRAAREISIGAVLAQRIGALAEAKRMSSTRPMSEAEVERRRALLREQAREIAAREAAGDFARPTTVPVPALVSLGVRTAEPPAAEEKPTAVVGRAPRVRKMRTAPVIDPLRVGRL